MKGAGFGTTADIGAAGPVALISLHEAGCICRCAPVLAANGQSRNAGRMDHAWRPGAGAFGAFIPLGIKIGLDAISRLNANREN